MTRLIATLSLMTLALPVFSQTNQCLANFKESGSIFKGKVLETYEDFAGIDVQTAVRRLQAQLPADGMTIVSVDAGAGIIRAENNAPNSRPFPIEFTVSAVQSGARVRLLAKMNAGMMVVGGTKPSICKTIQLATVEPPTPPPPPAPPEPALSNEEVVKLVEADLGDEIVIAKIKSSPDAKFEVSTAALVALKKAKVSKAVIAAMIERAGGISTTTVETAPDRSAAKRTPESVPPPVSEAMRRAKTLTRPAASALIQSSKEASTPQFEMVFLGADFRRSDFIGFGNWHVVDALARTGYVQNGRDGWALTGKGSSASADWRLDPDRKQARLIPMAHRKVIAVNGITEAGLNMGTIVEFSWVWRPTALAEELGAVEPRIAKKYDAVEQRGEALLKYYDDGWRVQKIEW